MLSDTPPARATSHSPSRSICAPWINAGIARRTGRADRVVRPGDAQVQRNFAGRIVGHGARIVMVRPELRVVVEPLELEDFVFGFDVAVLGDADVDADRRFIDIRPIEPGSRRSPRWRNKCRCCRPACRGGLLSSSDSAARRSRRRRPRSGRRSEFRNSARRFGRRADSGGTRDRLLAPGAVSPTPVMTIRWVSGRAIINIVRANG